MLGFEGHGLLTCFLHLDLGGSNIGFGGYCIDGEYASKWIKEILNIAGVEKWEDLEGKYIRVEKESGWNGKLVRIGHLLEDKWFNPKSL